MTSMNFRIEAGATCCFDAPASFADATGGFFHELSEFRCRDVECPWCFDPGGARRLGLVVAANQGRRVCPPTNDGAFEGFAAAGE
jgi:hypothetical protein